MWGLPVLVQGMNHLFKRKPGGEPAGGQFAGRERPCAEVVLVASELSEAMSPRTSRARLSDLAEHDDVAVREAVARSPKTQWEVRRFLVYDDEPRVRAALLDNEDLEPKVLDILIGDHDPTVRAAAATHGSASIASLTLMTADEDQPVRDVAELELHARGVDAAHRRQLIINSLRVEHADI